MPMKKKGGYKKRATAVRRRGKAKGRGLNVVKVGNVGLPDKMLVKLPYTDLTGIIGSGISNWYAQKAYNVNSLYDPETSALNDQNLYFDEYMRIYKSYRVYKVDYQVTLYNTSASATAGSISFDAQGSQMNILDISSLSKPYSNKFTLAPNGNTGSQKTIKGSIYMPRVLGLTTQQYRDAEQETAGGSSFNPGTIVQMSINLINVNQAVPCSIQADVRYMSHSELYGRTSTVVGTPAPEETH